MIRTGVADKGTLRSSERSVRVKHVARWGDSIPWRRNRKCQGSEAEIRLAYLRNIKGYVREGTIEYRARQYFLLESWQSLFSTEVIRLLLQMRKLDQRI